MTPELPEAFKSLEPHVDSWALPTETERWQRRLSSTMEEIRAFYDAVNPRLDDMVEYLNELPLDQMPEQATRLLSLALSLVEVAPAVELLGQPDSPDAFEAGRVKISEREGRS